MIKEIKLDPIQRLMLENASLKIDIAEVRREAAIIARDMMVKELCNKAGISVANLKISSDFSIITANIPDEPVEVVERSIQPLNGPIKHKKS